MGNNSKTEDKSPLNNKRGLYGLRNIRNICYLNAIIQCLSSTSLLLDYVLNQEYVSDIQNPETLLVIEMFANLIQDMWNDQTIPSWAIHVRNVLSRYNRSFLENIHHDAHELLRYLLAALHQELNSASSEKRTPSVKKGQGVGNDSISVDEVWQKYLKKDNSKILDIFGGLLKSTLKCTHCGFSSTVYELFWDLSLPIPLDSPDDNLNLNHCLELFTKEEELVGEDEPFCEKCKRKQTCLKRILIQKFPKILVIHLKRFSGDQMTRKINRFVDFPVAALNMGPYSTEAESEDVFYNLYGVVNHRGTPEIGHYTAFCKHPYFGSWHDFNDVFVTPMNISHIDKSLAYILFYEIENSTQSITNL